MNLKGIILLAVLLLGGLIVAALTRRRLLRLTGLAVVSIVVAVAGFYLWQFLRWDRNFSQIQVGDSQERVHQIMGRPTQATDATTGIYGSKESVTDRITTCTEQYWYYPFFTPECWWIALDSHGRVLATYHYISP